MKICLAQIPVSTDVAVNAGKINAAIVDAHEHGADILLTPEGSLSGYMNEFDAEEVSDALESIVKAAAAFALGLGLGTCYVESDGKRHNQIRFYNKSGRFIGSHSKILLCDSWANPGTGEISFYASADLSVFDFHGIKIGGLICNDMWANPECTTIPDGHLSQRLAGMGARVIFHAVNGGRNDTENSRRVVRNFHEANVLMRARSANVFIATVDNCAPAHLHCSSQGGVVSPQGEWLYKLPEKGTAVRVIEIDVS